MIMTKLQVLELKPGLELDTMVSKFVLGNENCSEKYSSDISASMNLLSALYQRYVVKITLQESHYLFDNVHVELYADRILPSYYNESVEIWAHSMKDLPEAVAKVALLAAFNLWESL
jgi:hypothetical protein